jgi:hypothetical protein
MFQTINVEKMMMSLVAIRTHSLITDQQVEAEVSARVLAVAVPICFTSDTF